MTEAGTFLQQLDDALQEAPLLEFAVAGVPGPQGSKSRNRYGAMYESSKKVRPWRHAVVQAALAAAGPAWVTLDGPIVMGVVFTMPKPKSAPKTLRRLPDRKPDLSKLVRSTEDALATDTKILADDARIVGYHRPRKVYERDQHDPDALEHPGAIVRLWRYPEGLLGKVELTEAQVRTML